MLEGGHFALPLLFLNLERHLAIIAKVRRETAGRSTKISVSAGSTVLLGFGVAKIYIVGNDLRTAVLAALLVRPVADLEPTLHDGHAALCEVSAHKLRSASPRDHINEVRLFFTVALIVAVNGKREG